MRLGIIVTEFPRITETFVMRDVLAFAQAGHEVRIYRLGPQRKNEFVHPFARPVMGWVRSKPFILDRELVLGLLSQARAQPRGLGRIVGRLVRDYASTPGLLLKSLAILPKSLAFAQDLKRWGAQHVHAEFAGHPATCAWIAARLTGIPYSVSCHANDIFRTTNGLAVKLNEAAAIRSISEFNKRFLLERIPGLSAAKIEVIRCGVDVMTIPRLEAPRWGEVYRILYIGSLEPKKGVDVLLHAVASAHELLPWKLDILGGGPERERLDKLASELGLMDRVVFHGPKPFEEVSAAIAEANIVVAPSVVASGGRMEGIPNTMIEALAHQRPAISTRLSGLPELIIDGETGLLVTPGNAEELRNALIWARNHPRETFEMACRGRRHVETHFDLNANARAQLQQFAAHALAS
jgi:colanic acid/amylovoran biosynthesis glycosyltransferase